MSTANFFNGYSNDKPSSRVLNPPGGRSNNIFGFSEEEPKNKNSNVLNDNSNMNANDNKGAHDALTNKTNQNDNCHGYNKASYCSSNIFGDAPVHNQANKPVNDRQKSNIFEDQSRTTNVSNKPRAGFNPITGQHYDFEQTERTKQHQQHVQHQQQQQQQQNQQQQQQEQQKPMDQPDQAGTNPQQASSLHTSSRVLQPPGGKSSGRLW